MGFEQTLVQCFINLMSLLEGSYKGLIALDGIFGLMSKAAQPCFVLALMGFAVCSQANNEISLGVGFAALDQGLGQGWRALPAPSLSIKYQGFSLATRGPGLAADLVPSQALSLGPLVRYSGGRSSRDLPSDYQTTQPDIPASAEIGLTFGSGIPWRVIGVPLPGILTVGADLVTTLPGGHETEVFAPSLGWVSSVTPRLTLIGSLGSQWGTKDNINTFFGVAGDPETGVEAYQPGAGLKDLSLSFITSYKHTARWSSFGLVSVSRYQGDAARSPLVTETDSLNRLFLVLGVSYTWSFD